MARIAGTATFVASLLCAPGVAQAGTYGDLDLDWTGTTVNWIEYPDRNSQTTYSPCFGAERLAGIGGYVLESAPSVPTFSEFKLGKAYVAYFHPVNYAPGVPNPESNRQVADHLFKTDRDIVMGETTLCASAAEPSYETEQFTAKGKARSTATAKCSGGSHVMSGGVKAAGPLKTTRLVESFPIDSSDPDSDRDDGWRVSVDNLKGKDRRATVHAICSDVDGFTYTSVSYNAPGRDRLHVSLTCPGGEYAIGGGVNHELAPRKAALVATRHGLGPTPNNWIVELDNLQQQTAVAKVFRVCHT